MTGKVWYGPLKINTGMSNPQMKSVFVEMLKRPITFLVRYWQQGQERFRFSAYSTGILVGNRKQTLVSNFDFFISIKKNDCRPEMAEWMSLKDKSNEGI